MIGKAKVGVKSIWQETLYINVNDALEIIVGDKMLNISVI